MPGIGPWTADYVRMRVLGDPDVFLPGDVAVRAGAAAAGIPPMPAALDRVGRPHRAVAQLPDRAPVARRAPPTRRRVGRRRPAVTRHRTRTTGPTTEHRGGPA